MSHRTPSASTSIFALPPEPRTLASINRVPKPRRMGASTFGPPFSAQPISSMPPLTAHTMLTAPSVFDNAPYLSELVPSSCKSIAMLGTEAASRCTCGPDAEIWPSSTGPSFIYSRTMS